MILCAGNNETFPFATPVGVGLIESAINATRIAMMNRPKELVFIGSAGSYGNHELFDIVHSGKGCNIEGGFFEKKCYTPIDNAVVAYDDPGEPMVNSSNYITASKEISQHFLAHGIELENMEFFALLQVAKEFELPIKGIFIVTNYCFEEAHKQFITNHKEAMERLTRYLADSCRT